VQIGPYAHIRPDSIAHDNVRIGNFVEIKKSVMEQNSKASHLTYVGDAEVGENVNLGCGTVFVNYDGKNKHKTIVKKNSFIGCNANLIAPITIGENVYVAAGSTVTEDIPDHALAIARSRMTIKQNWAKKDKS
jgi:bifunctional UDP-N-acetylglucosamine pyrophosphorylase/glucosamine-1-phosphate N-acetyltransferase